MAIDYVLDSSALIAYLDGEEGNQRVRDLLMQGRVGTATLWLHQLHLGEVYYIYRRRAGEGVAEEVLADISSLALRRVDRISLALLRVAGKDQGRRVLVLCRRLRRGAGTTPKG